jgi:hypothetical protein
LSRAAAISRSSVAARPIRQIEHRPIRGSPRIYRRAQTGSSDAAYLTRNEASNLYVIGPRARRGEKASFSPSVIPAQAGTHFRQQVSAGEEGPPGPVKPARVAFASTMGPGLRREDIQEI